MGAVPMLQSKKDIMKFLLLLANVPLVGGFSEKAVTFKVREQSRRTTVLYLSSSPSSDASHVQQQLLINRGLIEEELMSQNQSPISWNAYTPPKSTDGTNFEVEANWYAAALRREGVVRIDDVLPNKIADSMKEYAMGLRIRSEEAVDKGTLSNSERFAHVLLNSNRFDLTIPLGPPQVHRALRSVLCNSPVRHTIEYLIGGANATLYELSCLISDPGSQRQNIHPDNPCLPHEIDPSLLTCFIALQDIELTMGPTVWIPKTHTIEMHEQFQKRRVEDVMDCESPKDKMLRTVPSVVGLLPKGSCVIFDSRLLHCGGSNRSDKSRILFIFPSKIPRLPFLGMSEVLDMDCRMLLCN